MADINTQEAVSRRPDSSRLRTILVTIGAIVVIAFAAYGAVTFFKYAFCRPPCCLVYAGPYPVCRCPCPY